MGKMIPLALRDDGIDVILFHERFPKDDTDDDEWLAQIAEQNYVVITQDLRIRRSTIELKALYDAKLRCFMVGGQQLRSEVILGRLRDAWPKIEEIARANRGPFVYRVTGVGTVERRDKGTYWERVKQLSEPES